MMKLTLRLPEDLHRELKELAGKEHRSLHAQILHILTIYIEQLKKEKSKQG
jgi:predicted transcriptional regulator